MIKAKHIKGVNSNGYVLTTNASGVVSWAAASGGGFTYEAKAHSDSPLTPAAGKHYSINADGSSANFAINLPALSTFTDGESIRIKFRARSGSNNIVITAQSGENIDGSNTYTLDNSHSSITLIAGSTEWEIS